MSHPPKRTLCWALALAALVAPMAGPLRPSSAQAVAAPDARVSRIAYRQALNDELSGGVAWINSSGPIHLADLRGKVVLLDFWTFCCINCQHIIPTLSRLEEKYRNELVVIGVHSPKFPAERDTEAIRQKVREYGVKHPVVNDANRVIWQNLQIDSWPTLMLYGPDGLLVGRQAGELSFEALDKAIGRVVAEARAKGTLDDTPIAFGAESDRPANGPLLYPGKVEADAPSGRLIVSDTGHHRLVIADLEGKSPVTVGDGEPGLVDGDYAHARFNRPQGTCLVGSTLYVADTENHALRAVDLEAKTVTTVAGTGKQFYPTDFPADLEAGRVVPEMTPAGTTELSSPWDVIPIPDTGDLAIAMAGVHQIWRYDPEAGTVGPWAGSGRENILDGPRFSANFAQPSGLATDGKSIFVADSEVSGIRAIALDPGVKPAVRTIVGMGLFEFGDVDGKGNLVRLQHCLGVAYGGGRLYIADTYNNKIKTCNPSSRVVRTYLGTRSPGSTDDPAEFFQPGGLDVAGEVLYVADTNNHQIRAVDLSSKAVSTLTFEGLGPPVPPRRKPTFPRAAVVDVPRATVAPGDSVRVQVAFDLPEGFKVNPDAPMPYLVEAPIQPQAIAGDLPERGGQVEPPSSTFAIDVPLARPAEAGTSLTLKVSVSGFLCREGAEGLCTIRNFVWNVPITFQDGASPTLSLTTPAIKLGGG